MADVTRVEIEHNGEVATGTIAARRGEKIYVVVDGNPSADNWYPEHLWAVVSSN